MAAKKVERDCTYCQHKRLCKIYDGVLDAITGKGIVNFDSGDVTPGRGSDVFIALAGACTEWKPKNVNRGRARAEYLSLSSTRLIEEGKPEDGD